MLNLMGIQMNRILITSSLVLLISLFSACKKRKYSSLKAGCSRVELVETIPAHVKNKLYFEANDYALSVGMDFDFDKGLFKLANNENESNLVVNVVSKTGKQLQINHPKVTYEGTRANPILVLSDVNSGLNLRLSFPAADPLKGRLTRRVQVVDFKLGRNAEISDSPNSLYNTRTPSSILKTNRYFGLKSGEQWFDQIQKKLDFDCSNIPSVLCSSFARTSTDADTSYMWKMFDQFQNPTISSIQRSDLVATTGRLGNGRKYLDFQMKFANKEDMTFSSVLKMAGAQISPKWPEHLKESGFVTKML